MKNLSLIILFLSLFACTLTRVVNVEDYNHKTQETLAQAEKGVRRSGMDVADHEYILSKWSDQKSKQNLNRMRTIHQNILQNYIRLKEDFENTPFRQTKKITSQDKEFSGFSSHQQDFQSRFNIIDKQFDNYRNESLKLNAYLASKSIFKVNPTQVKDDFVNAINQAKREQLIVKNELMDYSVALNESSIDLEKRAKKKIIIQELVKMVEKIENETFKLQRLFNSSMKEINSGIKFVTPGMKAHKYSDKIQNHLKAIELQITEFNLRAKSLKD